MCLNHVPMFGTPNAGIDCFLYRVYSCSLLPQYFKSWFVKEKGRTLLFDGFVSWDYSSTVAALNRCFPTFIALSSCDRSFCSFTRSHFYHEVNYLKVNLYM